MAKKSRKLYLILEPLDLNMSCVRCGRPSAPGRAARTILAVRYIASAQLNALTTDAVCYILRTGDSKD